MTDATDTALPVPPYQRLRGNVPPGSSWGVFQQDPERGMANFAGPDQVLAAAAAVTRGITFNLDHALDAFDPPMARARRAPRHELLSSPGHRHSTMLPWRYLPRTRPSSGFDCQSSQPCLRSAAHPD